MSRGQPASGARIPCERRHNGPADGAGLPTVRPGQGKRDQVSAGKPPRYDDHELCHRMPPPCRAILRRRTTLARPGSRACSTLTAI
jgi:hypothetical protein